MAQKIGTRPIPSLSARDPQVQQFYEEVKFRIDNFAVPDGSPGFDPAAARVEAFTLTAANIAQKRVQLSRTPSAPNKTLIQLETGIAQYPNVDFYIDADFIRWNGLAMELLVEEGQRLHVTYQ